MISGNKGEWSEIYALFKLLGDKELHLGDKDIERLEEFVYPIVRVIRKENNGEFQYSINDEIVVISGGEKILNIPIVIFKEKAEILLQEIKTNNNGTFGVPEIESFMTSINCLSLKADSSTKTDITIVIHDLRTSQQPILGFSIKSQLGSPSTLLNAGKTTNFIFEISNLEIKQTEIQKINDINSKSKIMDRILATKDLGGKFKFISTERPIFSNNLILIDSKLPEILAYLVFTFYTSKNSKTVELVESIIESNPLNFDAADNHKFYEYKLKRFLTDVTLGMMPSKVWSGDYDATGGYLVIKESGDILCYHIYNKNKFEDYLFNNTKFETASSSRHDFGKIYEEDGNLYFKLNLQIRFIK